MHCVLVAGLVVNRVDPQVVTGTPEVVTKIVTEMVAPGRTVTLAPPFSVGFGVAMTSAAWARFGAARVPRRIPTASRTMIRKV